MQDSRSGAVNGGRSDQGNITLDGVDDNDQVNGFAFTGVLRQTQDSIEEFRVTTGLANADAGRSSGAQVSLITKSGTNKFHGAAYEYNRPTITVANDFFNKQAELNSGLPNRPGKLIRNIFGGDVGGPIFKDKLFFFANYEGTRQAESAQVSPHSTHRRPTSREYSNTQGSRRRNRSLTPGQIAHARCWLSGLQHLSLHTRPGTEPKRAGLFQLDARGQRSQRRRRPEYGLLFVLLAQPEDAEHHHRSSRLRPVLQTPNLRPRQSAEGHHRRRRAVSRARGRPLNSSTTARA